MGLLFNRFLMMSAAIAFGMFAGCGGKKVIGPPPAAPERPVGPAAAGQILELKAGARVWFDELVDSLASKDIVFIGEIHDNPEHHLIQIQILQSLLNRWGSKAAVGMEFFPRPVQGALDRYVQGVWNEADFLAAVDWEKLWGYDYHLYRPLMLAARERSVQILALNAPPEIVKKVAREGLPGLSDHERAQIAQDIDLSVAAHREFVYRVYSEHSHPDLKRFDDFYAAQAVWDETMAETIASHLKAKGGKMVVFAGNGHILHQFGVPDRTARRIPVSLATVVPYPVGDYVEGETGLADFLWLTQTDPRRHPGRMPGTRKESPPSDAERPMFE